ncbi:hypothetical protein AUC71_04180 [Methyloceanibacter marginalis]|uniref:LysR substrate-binding domain-containing protein n=1 Tax=Methyloceanibacter marginalis TaxID=1774971 RepID=A0A1E3VWG3_9HYPH|nr:hypothetical protein AUC71_04180 [Methyloceanibacter marginalis]
MTEPGRAYLETCRRVLADLDAAERRLAGEQAEPQGVLALTAPILFGRCHVQPVVHAYLDAYPRVSARMFLADRIVDLVEEELDLGIRIGHLPDSAMRATALGSVRYVCCASPAILMTPVCRRRRRPSRAIAASASPRSRNRAVGRSMGAKPQTVTVVPRLIVNTAEAAIDAAKAGLGIVRVLSYQAVEGFKDGSLRMVLEAFEPERLPVSLIHREDRLPQAKVQSFVALAVPRLRRALRDIAETEDKAPHQLPKPGSSC